MHDNNKPLVVDLFSGAGGLSKGLEWSGFKIILANEIHPDAALTYMQNHPDTKMLLEDASKLTGEFILKSAQRNLKTCDLDLLVGGPPCQGLSTAGLKEFDDPRNTLVAEFIRLLIELSPRYFLIENVPGMKTMYKGKFFQKVITMLDDTGYHYHHKMLYAYNYGIPQLRRRLFILGSRDEEAPKFPDPTHYIDPAALPSNKKNSISLETYFEKKERCITVGEAISDLPELASGQIKKEYDKPPKNNFQQQMRINAKQIYNHVATKHKISTIEKFKKFPEGGTQRDLPKDPETGKRPYKKNIQRWHRNKISRAITSEPTDYIHYDQDRIPTIRELARIQTFPDTFIFYGQRTAGNQKRRFEYCSQSQQVGNAIPPFLAKAIGQALIKQI